MTANEQIDTRRRFTESVLTGIKSGVLGIDTNDKIFLVNKSALELLENDASKLIGTKIFEIFPALTSVIKDIKNLKLLFKESSSTTQ